MKKRIFIVFLSILMCSSMWAQVSRTIDVSTAGTLSSLLGDDINLVTNLTLRGTIDATDFQTIKSMRALKDLDMLAVNITNGTIPASAFRGKVMDRLVLPSSLEVIGEEAFSSSVLPALDFSVCPHLRKIHQNAFSRQSLTENNVLDFSSNLELTSFPVRIFGLGAFAECKSHVIVPLNMTEIANSMFGCFQGSVYLNPNTTKIGACAFIKAQPSSELMLPKGITHIGTSAFSGFRSSRLILPSSLEVIGEEAFSSSVLPSLDFSVCPHLREIHQNAFSRQSLTENNVLDFSSNLELTSFPVRIFGLGAFAECKSHVIVPLNMTEIANSMFGCFQGSVYLNPNTTKIGACAFIKAQPSSELMLPKGITHIGTSAFSGFRSSRLILPSSLEVIGEEAFSSSVLPSLDFSVCPHLREIHQNAFSRQSLTENNVLDFSSNLELTSFPVRIFGLGTFAECKSHVIVPLNMTEIANSMFGCFQGSVYLNPNTTKIGACAFIKAQPSSELMLPKGITHIGTSAFSGFRSSRLILPSSLEVIGEEAFSSSVLPSLDFSVCPHLREIHQNAFSRQSLTENNVLDFSSNLELTSFPVRIFGLGTFAECKSHVIVPLNMTEIPNAIFGCFQGSVYLNSNTTKIGVRAFINAHIQEILLPASVQRIESDAFSGCTKLIEIDSQNPTPPSLGTNVFKNVDKNTCQLLVPDRSISLYGTANQWKDFLNIEARVPSSTSIYFTANDGQTFGEEYNAVRIGEYYWMDSYLREPGQFAITQQFVDSIHSRYLMFEWAPSPLPSFWTTGTTIEEYNYVHGTAYTNNTRNNVSSSWKMGEGSSKLVKNWHVPSIRDCKQLAAMCGDGGIYDVLQYLAWAHDDVDAPKLAQMANTPYWFHVNNVGNPNTNKYGFNWTATGWRAHVNGVELPVTTKYGYNKYTLNQGELIGYGQVAAIFTNENARFIINEYSRIEYKEDYSWSPLRMCRELTNEELGYKLYINQPLSEYKVQPGWQSDEYWGYRDWQERTMMMDDILVERMHQGQLNPEDVDILKLGLNESCPDGYVELSKGFIRGMYVQHILDNPQSSVSVADIMRMSKDSKVRFLWLTGSRTPVVQARSAQETKAFGSSSAIEEVKESCSIYPTVVTDNVRIDSSSPILEVVIYGETGNVVNSVSNVDSEITMSNYQPGIYIIKVQTAKSTYIQRVMKK
ncbi:T9SS C-terminal target domain-containing protein [Dysgonomonas sp. 216]|uniref:leucine-rich repeat domain-containing protein n=2 Tax=Dysgonomonas sp. 216 TaxID=2302934 RepID=UPI0013D75401|nr:leucine-rich repeat domain-containing protein [Dysgonomonas sp. 216]NDW18050.1 T9SS C-terminal target domain-containing protein [Dysgonomonas sp. 216]